MRREGSSSGRSARLRTSSAFHGFRRSHRIAATGRTVDRTESIFKRADLERLAAGIFGAGCACKIGWNTNYPKWTWRRRVALRLALPIRRFDSLRGVYSVGGAIRYVLAIIQTAGFSTNTQC